MKEFDQVAADKKRSEIEKAMATLGAGGGAKCEVLSASAMVGNTAAKEELTALLGVEIETMLDLYFVASVAHDFMTPAEKRKSDYDFEIAFRAKRSPEHAADEYLANKLGKLRRAAGMTQAELSKRSGVTLTTLQKLENGTNRILGARTEIILKIAGALNLTVEELVCSH